MAPPGTTIIIKKIKKGGHGHHGGAWKVAYADFVTAMMSFFLLLWLLAATPVENLKGLADYFSPTIGVQGKMGIGFSGGRSPDDEGFSRGNWASLGLIFGAPPSGPIIKFPDKDNETEQENQKVEVGKVNDEVTKDLTGDKQLNEFQDSILIEQTPDGLKINIMDTENRPMFKEGTAELEDFTKKILAKIAAIVKDVPNYLQVVGHTNSLTPSKDENYTNWELASERANASRRYLIKAGVQPAQIARIQAVADQEPLDQDHPDAPKNNRVTITLLRKTTIAYNRQPAPEEVIMGPVEAGLKTYIQNKNKEDSQDSQENQEDITPEAIAAAKATNDVKHFGEDDLDSSGKKKQANDKNKENGKDKKKTEKKPKKKKKKAQSSQQGG